MALFRLKYINEYVDSTGKIRRYFRRDGKQYGSIPGEVASAEFMEAYQSYLAQDPPKAPPRRHPDSLSQAICDFYASRMFTDLKPNTKAAYRSVLDAVEEVHGHRSASTMTAEHAEKIITKIGQSRPGMGNLTRSAMRRVFKLAVRNKRRSDNPFLAIEPYEIGEHHTWTEGELKQFQDFWRLGTRERLAFDLLLYTGQRVGDVANMKRAEIVDGMIHVIQQKTGAELWVPIHPNLTASMKAYKVAGMNLIGDPAGRPIKRFTLSHLIRHAVKKAGLPSRCVPHGLRKACLRRLAEGGGTAKELASISGHKTLREIARYTDAADQKTLAQNAMLKMTKEQ